ncbi:hypothetical protein ACFE04_021417 [Oxalis oulophora]
MLLAGGGKPLFNDTFDTPLMKTISYKNFKGNRVNDAHKGFMLIVDQNVPVVEAIPPEEDTPWNVKKMTLYAILELETFICRIILSIRKCIQSRSLLAFRLFFNAKKVSNSGFSKSVIYIVR